MAITKVQSWTVSMTGTSPVTSVPTSNLTPGSLLTVQAGLWGNNTQPNLGASDTTNGTWHVAVEGKFTTSPGDLQNGSIGYVKNSSAAKPTISISNPASSGNAFTAAVITEWTTDQSWATGTGALDVTANNANNTTIAQPSTGTTAATTGTGAMLVLAVGTSASSTITSTSNGWNTPSGYTSLFLQNDTSVDTSITADFKLLTTGAGAQGITYTADFSTAPSVDWAASIAVFKETTGGTSENLTGQTGTFTEGTISRAITKALTGQTATFTEGTITASTGGNVTLSLTGQSATFTEGALGLNIGYTLNDGVPLTGQTAAFTEGTPTGSISYTLGSQSATFTEGTIARAVSSALVGQSGTFTEGTLTRAASYPLVAQTATFTEGTISASSGGNVTLSLSGQTSTFSEGTIAPSVSLALLGQSTTYTPGSLTGSLSAALQGQTGTFSEGTVIAQATGDVTRSLFGQTATFTEGVITSSGTGAGRHRKRYAIRDGYKLLLFDTRKQANAYEASIQPKATPAQIRRAIKVKPTEKLDLTPLKAVQAFKTALASHDYEAIEKLARDHEEEEVAKNLLTQIRRESMDLSREITALLPNLMKTLRKKRNELRNRRKT